jgi:antitoxin ParD1/3/4
MHTNNMHTTNLHTRTLQLSEHWDVFIQNEISSGRYGSASDVICAALRSMEERKSKLDSLRHHLSQGATQAKNGEFIENFSIQQVISNLDKES